MVGKILGNSAYKGEAFAFRARYERVPGSNRKRRIPLPPEEWVPLPSGTIPPLVDEAMFAAVQERLTLNKQRSPRRTHNP